MQSRPGDPSIHRFCGQVAPALRRKPGRTVIYTELVGFPDVTSSSHARVAGDDMLQTMALRIPHRVA
jgi:hypothetical protein